MNLSQMEQLGRVLKEHLDMRMEKVESNCSHIPLIGEKIGNIEKHLETLNGRVGKLEQGEVNSRIKTAEIEGKLKGMSEKDKERRGLVWEIVSPVVASILSTAFMGGLAFFFLQRL